MARIELGQVIAIPCKIFPGPFHHEVMVIIEGMSGEVSGFVRRDALDRIEDDHAYIRARVVDVAEDTITVQLKGSFFTTTGLTEFSQEWTKSNAEVVAA